MSALALNAASLRYDNGFTALKNVTAQFNSGSFTALVGPSGCGKSSLLRLLAGLEQPFIGSVTGLAQSQIGFVFQEPTLLAWRSVADNITLPLQIEGHSPNEIAARLDEALALVGLTDFADTLPRQLSGGMKMRVSLARTLVLDPQLFLLDEPFGALDEITREKLNDDLLDLTRASGLTTLFVTHSVTEAVYLSNRVVVISERPGTIVEDIPIPFAERKRSLRNTPEFVDTCATVTETLYRGMEQS